MSAIKIPSPVGGFPTEADFVPSILFAIAFGLSVIPFFRRFFKKDQRVITIVLGTIPFSIERIVVYSVRASQSHHHSLGEDLKKWKIIYQQLSFAVGYLSFATDANAFCRALLVNTTLEDPSRGTEDNPRRRFWFRRFTDFYGLCYLASTIPGTVTYSRLAHAETNANSAQAAFNLRYASSGVGLFLLLGYIVCLHIFASRTPYVNKKGLKFVSIICAITAIVPLYRLIILYHTTPILHILPTTPPLYPAGSLTTRASKATFYLFHCLPELIVACFIQTTNLRKELNTGPFGDWRGSDNRGGIPKLRRDGVEVSGVGVEQEGPTPWKKPSWMEKISLSKLVSRRVD